MDDRPKFDQAVWLERCHIAGQLSNPKQSENNRDQEQADGPIGVAESQNQAGDGQAPGSEHSPLKPIRKLRQGSRRPEEELVHQKDAVGEQANRMTQAVTGGEGVSDVQERLSKTLRAFNGELNKFIDQMQSSASKLQREVDAKANKASDSADETAEAFEEKIAERRDRVEDAFDEATTQTGTRAEKAIDDIEDAFEQESHRDATV